MPVPELAGRSAQALDAALRWTARLQVTLIPSMHLCGTTAIPQTPFPQMTFPQTIFPQTTFPRTTFGRTTFGRNGVW
jgi:hypothetical protein